MSRSRPAQPNIASLWTILALSTSTVSGQAQHANPAAIESDLKRFTLADGLKLELFAAEPMLSNPVAFSIDGRGRMFIAESHRWATSVFDITQHTDWLLHDLSFRTGADREAFLINRLTNDPALLTRDSELVRLVEVRDGDHRADHSEVFADGFNSPVDGTAAGVLARGTNVWFANIPSLWRLNGGGREVIATGFGVHIGVSGHDLHGLVKGPDGRIYMSFGDRGLCITNREGSVISLPDTGGVLRCEPSGRNLEIFCSGLRNPQELAFDDLGNLWTVDNDTAGPDPCRVLHLVEGGDYGWRASYQHMKNYGPWISEELWKGGKDGILLPAGTVSQGPAGLAFYPGTGFGERFAGAFLHADFPGGIWAYTVKPQGASYVVDRKEKVLWNAWPTDVDFGPDGALYVLDWVSGWGAPGKGRIYRITESPERGAGNAELVAQTRRLLAEGMSGRSEKDLLGLLGHANRNVRLEAQWELADLSKVGLASLTNRFEGLAEVALKGSGRLARLHAVWGIGQLERQCYPWGLKRELAELTGLMGDPDEMVAAATMKVLGEARVNNAQPGLLSMLTGSSPRLVAAAVSANREILEPSRLTGVDGNRRYAPDLRFRLQQLWFEKILRRAAAGPTFSTEVDTGDLMKLVQGLGGDQPFLIHEVVRSIEESYRQVPSWTERWGRNTNAEIRKILVAAIRRIVDPTITNHVSDTDKSVALEAARAINDAPIPDGYSALAALLNREDFEHEMLAAPAMPRSPGEQILRRALSAHYRLGGVTNAQALATYAARTNAPATLRAEALFLLSQWEVKSFATDAPKVAKLEGHGASPIVNPENYPQWFNRVNGLWQPLETRPVNAAREALSEVASRLLADATEEVRIAAIQAVAALRVPGVEALLFALAGESSHPVSVRSAAVSALGRLDAPQLGDAVKLALADTNSRLRIAGLEWLARVDADPLVPELEKLLGADGDLPAKQSVLRALGRTQSTRGGEILAREFDRLLAGDYPDGLRLDLIESASGSSDLAVRERFARYQATLPADDSLAPFRPVLAGGDAARGKELFFNHPGAQCLRCHKLNGEGGIVGPDLTGIGRKQTREYLLASIILPNQAIAPGYENVTLTLRNGATHVGTVLREDDQSLTLSSPEEDAEVTIAKADLVSRSRGLSAMPEGVAALLSKRELRDLIEYLAALR